MNKQTEDIKVIREMMEKSSKFLSFNGLSIVYAGLFAIAGAGIACYYLSRIPGYIVFDSTDRALYLIVDAIIVLGLSVATVTFFCWRKAKRNKQTLFNSTTRRAAYNLLLPLTAGGIFSLIFLLRGNIDVASSATLLFYGLGLINASKYTFSELHYLGIIEVILGILAAIFLTKSILFWVIGFGVCHIIFGLFMYFKYDFKKK